MSNHDEQTFYNPETGAIQLSIGQIKGLPRTVRYENQIFQRVSELTVVLCSLKQARNPDRLLAHQSRVLHSVSRQLALKSVTFGSFTPPLSLCEDESGKAKSIITGAEVLGLREWVQGVREDAGLSLPMPHPYVTLFTRGDKSGVAVENLADRTLLCQPAKLPELEAMLYTNN